MLLKYDNRSLYFSIRKKRQKNLKQSRSKTKLKIREKKINLENRKEKGNT